MKKTVVLLPLIIVVFSSCSSNTENVDMYANNLYSDKECFKDDKLEFNFHDIEEYHQGDTYLTYVSMDLVSRDTKPVEVKLDSLKMIRESNNAEYAVSGYYQSKFTLECDIKKTIKFSSTIPTSYKTDNCRLEFKYNSKDLIYHFYEMPDELRKDIDITSEDIMNVLHRKPGSYFKEIYDTLTEKILKGEIVNNNKDLLQFVVDNYSI